MINYFIQVLIFQTIFLVIYDLMLKKETFFQWNRTYLILISVLSYVIPLIKFTEVNKNIPQEYRVILPEVVLSPETYIKRQISHPEVFFTGIQWLLIIGGIIASLVFVYKIYQLLHLIRTNDQVRKKDYTLVLLSENYTSFSFFHYVFLGKKLLEDEQIIAHELVHVRQKHSIDLLFFELQKILLWFNPYSYFYQSRLADLHEFIADAETVNRKEKSTFYHSLLAGTFSVDKLTFVNSYNKPTLIKKRIIMFSKKKSKEIAKLKYLWLIPVLTGMLVYTSCENTNSNDVLSKTNEKHIVKVYIGDGVKTERKELTGKKEGYLDQYLLGAVPEGNEISYNDLTPEEKSEFDTDKYFNSDKEFKTFKFFEMKDGTRAVQEIINWSKMKENWKPKDLSDAGAVPFIVVDQVPVYPGCENAPDQKKCMSDKITELIRSNFNTDLSKNLGLKKGKKRVYVQFTIDKTGNITDIRSRGPHKDLEKEATRVIELLPKMQPGKQKGKKVDVKYTLPISFIVE